MTAWGGSLLMPTAKGPRISRIRTSALVADEVTAQLLAMQYAALTNPAAGHLVIVGETPLEGVRVVSVVIASLRKVRVRSDDEGDRTYQVDADWELAV